ncbi:MAG: hypothetical protein UV95_C0001G0218 [Candidatus Falkowbacteria bacterium GW2011_GWF2_43_32]|nr:MAG: hypothetical protein UV95_C0001G0218 [Candidatus Falkowbacteria bacterium GW2011_GWF2_43_32]
MFKPFLTKWPFLLSSERKKGDLIHSSERAQTTRSDNPLFKWRLFLGLILVMIIGLFLYFKIVPFGRITYSRAWPRGLASGKGFIYDFKPAERLIVAENGLSGKDKAGLKVTADQVYFSLFTPRRFDTATVTVKYRERLGENSPLIELGVLQDKLSDSHEMRPIQNDILDELRFSWPRLEDTENRLILQAVRNYSSPEEFERDLNSGQLPDCLPGEVRACVALYNYTQALDYRRPDYQLLFPAVIDQPLRGAHQFYVYFNGPWRLGFDFVDLNQDKAADPITVQVWSGEELVATQFLFDENLSPDSGQTENKELSVQGDAVSGVYRVEVKVSPDIVIAKINSSSDKISFIDKVWPVSGRGGLVLFTDSAYLEAKTFSPASLGSLHFGEQEIILDKTHESFGVVGAAGVKEIKLPIDDVILSGRGVFSFSRAALFNPDFRKMDHRFTPGDGVKYIIASYERPLVTEGIKTAQATFDLRETYRENDKYTFMFSVPGLKASDGADDYLEIKEIRVTLVGKTVFDKLGEWFKK